MELAIVSDLHLEINGLVHRKFGPADVLIVAGDFVNATQLEPRMNDSGSRSTKKSAEFYKKEVFPNYRYVIITVGNHEYYSGWVPAIVEIMKEYFADCPNVHVMENRDLMVDNVYFLGCTLWTDMNKGDPLAMSYVQRGMNDYRIIYKEKITNKHYALDKQILQPEDTMAWHDQSIKYLKAKLKEYKTYQTVVVTHHAPSSLSVHPSYKGDMLNFGYYSDLSSLIEDNPQIKLWVHGHTHHSCDYDLFNTRVFSNQMGYTFEGKKPGFNPKATVVI